MSGEELYVKPTLEPQDDPRRGPRARTFVCSNPNFIPAHAFAVVPGDTAFLHVVTNKKGGAKRVYICNVVVGRKMDGSPILCGGRLYSRRTTKRIPDYPDPTKLLRMLQENQGWDYSPLRVMPGELEIFRIRDRALVTLLYLGMLRVTEALQLRRSQFEIKEGMVSIHNVQLVKRKVTNPEWRELINLPLHGPRAPFTGFVIEHLKTVSDPEAFVFSGYNGRHLGRRRAHQIVTTLTGQFSHAFRAFGEDYMAHQPGVLLIDLAAYVKVNPAILATYIHGTSSLPVV
jgi:integrase